MTRSAPDCSARRNSHHSLRWPSFPSPASDFPSNPPARATFAVKDLPKGGLVEIEAIAVHN